MTRTLMAPEHLKNESLPLARVIDNLYLGSAIEEEYTVPADIRYGVISANYGVYVKKNPLTLAATPVGTAFANQPANDKVGIVSDDAGDTTQTATVIGTTNGTDTVVVETGVALSGLTPGTTSKADWGVILAVVLDSACVGTVTVSENSASQTITTLAPGVLSKGVVVVSGADTVGGLVQLVGSGATTKQIGIKGTNGAGAVIYDSQALNGTTAVYSNSVFASVTAIYIGDLEATRTVTPRIGAATVPAADETYGFSSLYIPTTRNVILEAGTKISVVRATGNNTIVSIELFS